MSVFEVFYWLGVLVELGIRAPLNRQWKAAPRRVQRISLTERILLGILWLAMFILPTVYSAFDWLDFANYRLPDGMGWLGVVLLAGALAVFIRAHMDLKANWSPTLEIFEGHTLITTGIYAHIRHPIYASQWLWVIAQALVIQNWIAGVTNLLFFAVFYPLRVSAEERMMLDIFGDDYLEYMRRTGAVIPKFNFKR